VLAVLIAMRTKVGESMMTSQSDRHAKQCGEIGQKGNIGWPADDKE
jgi:hypothetical protein